MGMVKKVGCSCNGTLLLVVSHTLRKSSNAIVRGNFQEINGAWKKRAAEGKRKVARYIYEIAIVTFSIPYCVAHGQQSFINVVVYLV